MDSYTEVQHRSWISRVMGSFVGAMVGFVLVPGSAVFLFWNEGNFVRTKASLGEAQQRLVRLAEPRLQAEHEGQVVYLSGEARATGPLVDREFGISERGLAMEREVRVYRWEQDEERRTRKKVGGGETTEIKYTYRKDWGKNLPDSSGFKVPEGHENPRRKLFEDRTLYAEEVKLGDFRMDQSLVRKVGGSQLRPLSQEEARGLAERLGVPGQVSDGEFYVGESPFSPAVGDHRVAFKVVPEGEVSLVASQLGTGLVPYTSSNGKEVALVSRGQVAPERLFQLAQEANEQMTWMFRLIGFIASCVAFGLIFNPLSKLADIIPFIGTLIGWGTGLVSLILGTALSGVTIGVAWLFYRPLYGGLMIGAALALLFLARRGERPQRTVRI